MTSVLSDLYEDLYNCILNKFLNSIFVIILHKHNSRLESFNELLMWFLCRILIMKQNFFLKLKLSWSVTEIYRFRKFENRKNKFSNDAYMLSEPTRRNLRILSLYTDQKKMLRCLHKALPWSFKVAVFQFGESINER